MSHEAQEALADYAHKYMGLATDPSEWRETARDDEKGPHGEEYDHATYRHSSGAILHAVTHVDDGEEWAVIEGGELLYDLGEDENMKQYGGGIYINFCPKDFWERNQYIPSDIMHEHEAALLMLVHGLPVAIAENEMMEGNFGPPAHMKDMATVHSYLQAQGYEYRDMTVQPGAPVAPTPLKDGGEVTPRHVLQPVLEKLSDPAFNGAYIGQLLVDEFEKYGDTTFALEPATLALLDRAGIPDALNNVFSDSDKDELIARLTKITEGQTAGMTAVKLVPALNKHNQAADEAKKNPADLTGLQMDEVYRLALRSKVPQIAAIGWCWDESKEFATEDELAWICGYVDFDGKLIRDLFIPDKVFEGWFPEYRKATFNDYEKEGATNLHTMPLPDEQFIDGVKAIIASRYADRGPQYVEDMISPPPTPLVAASTSVPTRTAPVVPVATPYTAGQSSNIVTLKAYPAGHTGVAAPVAAQAAPAPQPVQTAPQSASTNPTADQMWREYQMDLTALQGLGVERAGYQIVNTTPHIVFATGFLDSNGGIVEALPVDEVLKLFSEYTVSCLDDGTTYRIIKLFGQQLSDLEKVVHERLQSVKIFDAAS